MDRAKKITAGILKVIAILAVLQLARIGVKSIVFLFVERTDFTDRAASLIAMALLSVMAAAIARRRSIELSVFPKHFGAPYIIASVIAAALLVGYADALAFRAKEGLLTLLCWKAVTGLCFGLVLGAVRLKTKNSYSSMLLHGALNIFGR